MGMLGLVQRACTLMNKLRETTHSPDGAKWFTTTHWSVVLAAGNSTSPTADAALERLCVTYRYPLYAYLRRKGYTEHDAEDLTQGFFARLLERHAFRSVTPNRGAKFRTFLLTALNHFATDERDRQQAQKRGGGKKLLSFDAQRDEERYCLEPGHEETPEKLFERRWALALLDSALAALEQEYRRTGKTAVFEQLRGALVEGVLEQSYAQAGAQIGMTEEGVKKAAQRLRRRYQEILREEIRNTVASPAEVEEELRHLWSVMGA